MRVEYDDVETDGDLRVTYQGEPFTGEVVERSSEGQIIATTTYFKGMEDGPSSEWYPTGERRATDTVRYGMAIGAHEEWHRNGILAIRSDFDDHGKMLSRHTWAQDGTPLHIHIAET